MGETGKPGRRCLRPVPCPDYDVEGMESWLTDMEARGLRLSREGFFAGVAICRRLARAGRKAQRQHECQQQCKGSSESFHVLAFFLAVRKIYASHGFTWFSRT